MRRSRFRNEQIIEILKEQMDSLRAAGKAAEGSKSSAANMAIMVRTGEKIDASIAKHGMTKDEYNWVSGELGKLWYPAILQQQWEESGKPDLEKQIKDK